MKKTNFFSHDANARNDDKLLNVRMAFGAEGYGIYFMILERLREETDYMSVKDYNMIAFDLRVDASKVKKIVEEFGLFVFTEDGEYFYSESFLQRMEIKDNVRQTRSEAGKKGAQARWEKEESTEENGKPIAKPWQTHSKAMANAYETDGKPIASKVKESKESKEKESKEKDSKVKQRKESVRSVLEDFCGEDKELLEAFYGFVEMRRENKSKLTVRAVKLAITELTKLSQDPQEQIAIIQQSILKGWKSFYRIKEDQTKGSSAAYFQQVDEWARG